MKKEFFKQDMRKNIHYKIIYIIIFIFLTKIHAEQIYLHLRLEDEAGPLLDAECMAIIESTCFWGKLDQQLGRVIIKANSVTLPDQFMIWCICPEHSSKRELFKKSEIFNNEMKWSDSLGVHYYIGKVRLVKSHKNVKLIDIYAIVESSIKDTISLKNLHFFSTVYNTRNEPGLKNKIHGYVPMQCLQAIAHFLVWKKYYKSYSFYLSTSVFLKGIPYHHEKIIIEPGDLKKIFLKNINDIDLTIDGNKINFPVYFGDGGHFIYGEHEFIAQQGYFKYSRFVDSINENTDEDYPIKLNDYSPKINLINIPSNAILKNIQIEFTLPMKIVENFNYYYLISSRLKSENLSSYDKIINDFKKDIISLRWMIPIDTIDNVDGSRLIKGYIKIPVSYLTEEGFINDINDAFQIDFYVCPFGKDEVHSPFHIKSLSCNYSSKLLLKSSFGIKMNSMTSKSPNLSNYCVSYETVGIIYNVFLASWARGLEYNLYRRISLSFGIDFVIVSNTKSSTTHNIFSFYLQPSYFNTRFLISSLSLVLGEYFKSSVIYYNNSVLGSDQYSFMLEPGVTINHTASDMNINIYYVYWPYRIGYKFQDQVTLDNWHKFKGWGIDIIKRFSKISFCFSYKSIKDWNVNQANNYCLQLMYDL